MNSMFERNIGTISKSEQEKICQSSVFLAGVGGLGGFVAEELVRVGIGSLTLCDFDKFSETNLNRQLYANSNTIGKNKAEVAMEALKKINNNTDIKILKEPIFEKSKVDFGEFDVIVDALDNAKSRIVLEQFAHNANKTLVHGAVGGWWGEIGVSYPGDFLIEKIFSNKQKETKPSVIAPVAGLIASALALQTVKLLLEKPNVLKRNELWLADLENMKFETVVV